MNFVEQRRQPAAFTQHTSGGEQFARILIVDKNPAVANLLHRDLHPSGGTT